MPSTLDNIPKYKKGYVFTGQTIRALSALFVLFCTPDGPSVFLYTR